MAIMTEDWIADWETITCKNCVNDIMLAFEKEEMAMRGEIYETHFNENNN